MELTGKVALVTGAAKRVGRAIALELASAGCDIVVHYRSSQAEAQSLVEDIQQLSNGRATAVGGDLADRGVPQRIVDEAVAAMGRLDILINNGSVFDSAKMDEWTNEHWERTFRVNAIAPALLAQAAAPIMRRNGGGRIVNLTDILADRPAMGLAAYCASKAALVNITKSLARELAPTITVNAISPAVAIFPESYDQAARESLLRRVPLQREGTPEGVAALVRCLVTRLDYITGQVIPFDGGRSIVP